MGRQEVGGGDVALSPTQYDAIAKAGTGRDTQIVPQSTLGSDLGRTLYREDDRKPLGILLSQKIAPNQRAEVYAHELGHTVSQYVGEIPTNGLMDELRFIYNDTNNERLNSLREMYQKAGRLNELDARIASDKNLRNAAPSPKLYSKSEIPQEYMAEAIRAYEADPNYIKTVAPNTAARIREYVNSHPLLKDIIQFNTVAPATVGLGALGLGSSDANARSLPGSSYPTDTIQNVENPWLDAAGDFIDRYVTTPIPGLQHPLEGTSNLLHNFGRDRPWQQRLSDAFGPISDLGGIATAIPSQLIRLALSSHDPDLDRNNPWLNSGASR